MHKKDREAEKLKKKGRIIQRLAEKNKDRERPRKDRYGQNEEEGEIHPIVPLGRSQ